MRNRLKICPNDWGMEDIAHIYVIYFQASLFPLTFAPAPQQGQLTVSTSYMNVTLRHKSVDISAGLILKRRMNAGLIIITRNTCIAEPREAWGEGAHKGWEDRREMK